MSQPDQLFSLIQSLSKSEKRYYKVHAAVESRNGKNNLLRFFDTVADQKTYDEKQLKTALPTSITRYFPAYKYKLYRSVLDHLTRYHRDNSLKSELEHRLQQVELLHKKGLYKPCKKLLRQVKKTAHRFELFPVLLQVIRWEQRIARSQADISDLATQSEQRLQQEKELLDKHYNSGQYLHLYTQMLVFLRTTGDVRTPAESGRLEQLFADPLLQDIHRTRTYLSRNLFYLIHAMKNFVTRNLQEAYQNCKQRLNLLESRSYYIKEDPTDYLNALDDLSIVCAELKRYEELKDILQKIRNLQHSKGIQSIQVLYKKSLIKSYIVEQNMFIDRGDFEKGAHQARYIENQLSDLRPSKAGAISLYYNMAYIYLGNGQYKKALTWINKTLHETDITLREDMHSFARILNLIIHYELGHTDILDYLVKSTYRFLSKKERLYNVETALLDFIRKKLPKISPFDRAALLSAFRSFREELLEITQAPYEANALKYFNFIAWLESKIYDRPFAAVIRQKASGKNRGRSKSVD